MPQPFFTIGHSTRTIAEFVALLRAGEVTHVADIRTVPRSRTNPQYNSDALPGALSDYGIGYTLISELGGLRAKSKTLPPEVNGFWTNKSFHNYADYALTDPFADGLAELIALGRERRVAMMCSEAVWWRCHRRIVADYLLARGDAVFHLMGADRVDPARLTPGAEIGGNGAVTYPAVANRRYQLPSAAPISTLNLPGDSHMQDIVITAAKRTPVGSFLGAFAQVPAHELGRTAIEAALQQAGVKGDEVSEVIMGQVLTAGQGQNPARQASMAAGVPKEIPAWGVNQVCGSGLRAVALAAQAVATGDATIVVAGGQESMSLSMHAQNLRGGTKMGGVSLVDTMITDGLTDVFNGYHMGITAENLAEKYQLTRGEQDEFSVASQNKAEKARAAGRFKDEIAPVTVKGRKGDTVVEDDEYIRAGVTLDSVSGVRPAFKKDGTVTAANASGLNDGAAALVVMTREEAEKRGAPILATIRSWASAGVDPSIMGIGPVPATKRALEKAGWSVADLHLIEANEAFAAQALSVGKELGWDAAKVNVNGGAIAIGHPIGASGARVLTTLLYEMQKRDAKKGLATLCIGGGMGIAMCVERD